MDAKQKITVLLKEVLKEENLEDADFTIEHPKDFSHGDYSTNVALVAFAKHKVYKTPLELAQEIVSSVGHLMPSFVEKVEAVKPGFINFWLAKGYLIDQLKEVVQVNILDATAENSNKKVVVEYSSPNIAKPFTVGHLRSTIIGDAVANLLRAVGWKVYRDNHLGDWGTQFGKMIYAIKTWGNESEIEKAENPVKPLVDLYVKFHKEAEANPSLEDSAREWFKKLEEGNSEARRLWQKCVDWSLKEFKKIYQELGIEFTENNGVGYSESFFEDKIQLVIEELRRKELLKESEDAELVFFPNEKFPPLMILKKDGTTLYSTRDLATDKFRLEKYGKDVLVINEVGNEQSLYFDQLFEVEKMLGWYKEGQRIHIKHGLYRFKDEKMSTRKGNTIWLEDLLHLAIVKADDIAMNAGIKNHIVGGQTKRNEITQQVAIGAIKWNDLKRSSYLDIVFDWDEVLNMEGNSGPYLQYVYARTQSVLRKAPNQGHPEFISGSKSLGNEMPKQVRHDTLEPEETALLRLAYRFPEVVGEAAENFAPNILCNYLFEQAQGFNTFYQKHKIIGSEKQDFRLALTKGVGKIIKEGLNLLGIQAPEEM